MAWNFVNARYFYTTYAQFKTKIHTYSISYTSTNEVENRDAFVYDGGCDTVTKVKNAHIANGLVQSEPSFTDQNVYVCVCVYCVFGSSYLKAIRNLWKWNVRW